MADLTARFRQVLTPEQEQAFQRDMEFAPGYREWRQQFARQYGEYPDINDPSYDYRTAWRLGVVPEPYGEDKGRYHWWGGASAPPPFNGNVDLKAPDHTTRWMEDFYQKYGIDPNGAPQENLVDALRQGIVKSPGPAVPSLAQPPSLQRTVSSDAARDLLVEGLRQGGPWSDMRWMENFQQQYKTDPNEASVETLVDALRQGIVKARGY